MMDKCYQCKYYVARYSFIGHYGLKKCGGICHMYENFAKKRKCDFFEENIFHDEELKRTINVLNLCDAIRRRFIFNTIALKELSQKAEELFKEFEK